MNILQPVCQHAFSCGAGRPINVHQRAAMRQLSAKVFKLSFEYMHTYGQKVGDFAKK